MRKEILGAIILGVAILISAIIIWYDSPSDIEDRESDSERIDSDRVTEDESGENGQNISNFSAPLGGGGAGGGSGGSNGGSGEPGDGLPADFNQSPCGFYFREYEVCGGSCSVGECFSEGRSCYCRVV